MTNPTGTTLEHTIAGHTAHLLKVNKLDPRATLPTYGSAHAAGMDLAALIGDAMDDGPDDDAKLTIEPMQIVLVPTGLAIAIEPGYEAQIRPRSGLSTKHGITMPNSPGTIDADYRGHVKVPLINLGRETFTVTSGMRIAQMVIAPVVRAQIIETDELGETQRGAGGFGSTGV